LLDLTKPFLAMVEAGVLDTFLSGTILEYDVHAEGSFFFRVDILRGKEEGEDALDVAAEDVTGVE